MSQINKYKFISANFYNIRRMEFLRKLLEKDIYEVWSLSRKLALIIFVKIINWIIFIFTKSEILFFFGLIFYFSLTSLNCDFFWRGEEIFSKPCDCISQEKIDKDLDFPFEYESINKIFYCSESDHMQEKNHQKDTIRVYGCKQNLKNADKFLSENKDLIDKVKKVCLIESENLKSNPSKENLKKFLKCEEKLSRNSQMDFIENPFDPLKLWIYDIKNLGLCPEKMGSKKIFEQYAFEKFITKEDAPECYEFFKKSYGENDPRLYTPQEKNVWDNDKAYRRDALLNREHEIFKKYKK